MLYFIEYCCFVSGLCFYFIFTFSDSEAFFVFQFLLYNMSLELGSPHTYTQLSMKQVNIVHKNGRLQYEN